MDGANNLDILNVADQNKHNNLNFYNNHNFNNGQNFSGKEIKEEFKFQINSPIDKYCNYNQNAHFNDEFNNKYIEGEQNGKNNNNYNMNSSVKNINPEEFKELELNQNQKFRGYERNNQNYYCIGAYEKHKDQINVEESPQIENRNSFVNESKKSNLNLKGKKNELRYLKGKY